MTDYIKCPHNELAYSATSQWCETCGVTLDPEDTSKAAGPMIGAHGQLVRMTWAGGTRLGRISGDFRSDSLPTGATFVPVTWEDDGTTDNVDTRVLAGIVTEYEH